MARAGELPLKVRHLGVGEGDELEALLLARRELLVREDCGLPVGLGIEPVFVQATQPRPLDVLGCDRGPRRAAAHGVNQTRVRPFGQHGPSSDKIMHPDGQIRELPR
jgi:hypothetical protein